MMYNMRTQNMLTLRSALSQYPLALVMDELARQFEEDVRWGLLLDVLADGIVLVKMSYREESYLELSTDALESKD